MIKVVCGIIYQQDNIFICRRKEGKSLSGFWEFPGGKIEDGEKHEESLKRELMEELKMEVDVIGYFDTAIHHYQGFSIELIAYKCTLVRWEHYLSDHDRFNWVSPKVLTQWKLAPADIPLAEKLRQKAGSNI
ncbi:MAG: (deoxy)nucleoside triphosphate pyrophosphohydrolase [Bacteroidota bacterium]